MLADLSVTEAVGKAYVRRIHRIAAIDAELDELGWRGLIAAADLVLLEDNGFMLDFETGRVVDTTAVVNAEAVSA